MTDVFVSYARSDRSFVAALSAVLTERGKQVWVDLDSIPPSAEWLAEIVLAIEAADNVLCVLSPSYLASEICAMELQHALELGKRLIPVVRVDVNPVHVPPALRALNWLFWRESEDADAAAARTLAAIETDPGWLKAHTRILVHASEWQRAGEDSSRLLSGKALREAESWLCRHGGEDPAPTPLQRSYIAAGRRLATIRTRVGIATVVLAVVSATALTMWGLEQRKQTARRAEAALARELIVKANGQPAHRPELRAFLAIEALRRLDALGEPTHDASQALRAARSYLLPPVAALTQPTPVTALRFSDDGVHLGSSDAGHVVRVWATAAWIPRGAFKAPRPIQSFAITADGRAIGAGVRTMDEVEAHVMDLTRGTPITTLTHPGETLPAGATFNLPLHSVLAVSLLGAGDRALTGGVSSLRLWSLAEGAEILRAAGIPFATGPIRIGADDTHVAVQTLSHERYVVSLEDGKRIARTGERILALGVNGARLLRGEGRQATLNASGDGVVASLRHDGEIHTAAFSADGHWLATGAQDGSARLWDANDAREIARIGHDGAVTALAFSPDASRIVLAGASGRLQVRAVEDPREPLRMPADGAIASLAISADGRYLATGTESPGSVSLWDAANGRRLARMTQTHAVRQLAFSADGAYLASLDIDATHIWSVPSGEPYLHLAHRNDGATGYKAIPWALAFSADGRYLALGGSFPFTRIVDFNARNKRRIDVTGSVVALRFLEHPQRLLAASGATVRVLDLEQRETLRTFSHERAVTTMSVSRDGRRLAVADDDGGIRIWDMDSNTQVFQRRIALTPKHLAFSHDSSRLAVAGDRTAVVVYRVADGRLDFQAGGEGAQAVRAMAFSPIGPQLATAGVDRVIRVWDVETKSELENLELDSPQSTLLFSPTGRHLLSGGIDSNTLRWLWRHDDLIADTCARLSSASMSEASWSAFLAGRPYRATCSQGGQGASTAPSPAVTFLETPATHGQSGHR